VHLIEYSVSEKEHTPLEVDTQPAEFPAEPCCAADPRTTMQLDLLGFCRNISSIIGGHL
jgi:hypothetical protein